MNLENAVEPRLAAQLGEIARPFGFFVLTIAVAMLARENAKIPSRFRLIASTGLGSTAFSRMSKVKMPTRTLTHLAIRQRGIADSIVLAMMLPILLPLLAAVADLARRPIVRSHLLAALQDATLQAERKAFENDSASARLLDDAFPAAQSLCEAVAPTGDCTLYSSTPGAIHGVLNPALASTIVSAAGELFETGLAAQTSGLMGITRPDQWAACFALVRLPVDRGTGMMSGPFQMIGSSGCNGDPGFVTLAQATSGLSVNVVAQHLRDGFAAQGAGAGAWPLLDGFEGSAGIGWGSPRRPWLPSVWLVSTAYFEVDYYFPGLSGSKEVLAHWYVRALSTPAAIQQAGL